MPKLELDNSVVRDIIRGTDELNRKRKEIHMVVTTLVELVQASWGLYEPTQGAEFSKPLWTPFDDSQWHIARRNNKLMARFVRYEGRDRLIPPPGRSVYATDSSFHTAKGTQLAREDVGKVHTALVEFIHGMVRMFPGLQGQIEPILRAAKQ